MNRHSFVKLLFVFCFSGSVYGNQEKIIFSSPLYSVNNKVGKYVSNVISVEMFKMQTDGKLKNMEKVDFSSDTLLLHRYQGNEIKRDEKGFIQSIPDGVVQNTSSLFY